MFTKLDLYGQPTMKTILHVIVFVVLHVHPTVTKMVQCYATFSSTNGQCSDVLGQVSLDDCCMNLKYGYQDESNECKSCRFALWTEWSSWSSCTVTCSDGVRQRRRACYGIGICPDSEKLGSIQTEPCADQSCCPENGGWSNWGAWAPCSVTCEKGVMSRNRFCTEPPPKCMGTCVGMNLEATDCDTGIVCPTHGGWSSWSNWGPCAGTCKVEGFLPPEQQRTRTCTNPPPSIEPQGNDCQGSSTDIQQCAWLPFCPENGNWGAWSSFSPCSVTCGVGRHTKQRECDNPAPKHGGQYCSGQTTEISLCTIQTPCPADGHWAEWEAWTACRSTNYKNINCLNRFGTRMRRRKCVGCEYGGKSCPGENWLKNNCYDVEKCKVGPKEQIPQAKWSEWSDWSYCQPNCGQNSTQTRKRVCEPDRSKYSEPDVELAGTLAGNLVCLPMPITEETKPCFNVPEC
ncbi:properdin isoform X2 [Trichomycterus rosablanca]